MNEKYQIDKMCECGDTDAMHIDGDGQCFISECSCKEFTEEANCEQDGHDFQVEDFSPEQADLRCRRCGKVKRA